MKKNIQGIKIIKKKIISDHRGKIMHMMRSDDRYYNNFYKHQDNAIYLPTFANLKIIEIIKLGQATMANTFYIIIFFIWSTNIIIIMICINI